MLLVHEDGGACAFSEKYVGEGETLKKLSASVGTDHQKHGVLARASNQSLQAASDKDAPDADKNEEALDERGSSVSTD